jgi:hypothetical protein
MTQKTTNKIRTLLSGVQLDYEQTVNDALNHYLPKIFHCCPFTEEIFTIKQCQECEVFKKQINIY